MGCQMEAMVASESKDALNALQMVPGWFEKWEQALSRFRLDSELSSFNHSNGEPVQISRELWDVLQISLQAAEESGGLVTPAILDVLEAAGYDRSFESLSLPIPFKDAFYAVPAIENILMDASTKTVVLPEGMRLDFGGSAKGWAAYQAARRLAKKSPALVNAGGDIAIFNSMDEAQLWEVGIVDPLKPEALIARLSLNQGGVATSGTDYRRWMRNDREVSHIIDPRTNQPVESDVLTSTVIAPNTMEAEMAAKTSLLLGSQAGLNWLQNRPALAGLMVLQDGSVLRTDNTKDYLVEIYEREFAD